MTPRLNWLGKPSHKCRPFRARDRVVVHWGNGRTTPGRVICHNRRNKYDLSVMVLYETEGGFENCESFKPDGLRWETNDPVYITHAEGT